MGTFATGAVTLGGEEDEEDEERCEVDHLPPLLEDEENVSLADILCLRDGCLSEQEVWAVCAECVCSLQSIAQSPLFHTLCVTPDTLAFNAHGNVCFMELLSDDPDGSFVPPELDRTGNTFEGHVFSLGSTLSAALNYAVEPELEAELGADTKRLLEQMQEEKPENRPRPQDILSQADIKLTDTSSTAVCRMLSAIGRRVLSIESIYAFQDEWEKSRHQFLEFRGSRSNSVETHTGRHYSSESYEEEDYLTKQRRCVCHGSFRSGSVDEYSTGPGLFRDDGSPCQSQSGSPVHRRQQERKSGRARSALNRSCSVPDSNNPPAFSPPSRTDISRMVTDLSEIGGEESMVVMHWEERMLKGTPRRPTKGADPDRKMEAFSQQPESSSRIRNSTPLHASADTDLDDTEQKWAAGDKTPVPSTDMRETTELSGLCCNHMTKSMLCLNEESQDEVRCRIPNLKEGSCRIPSLNEWISLRELLLCCLRPLSIKELWALCYTCLSTLQTYTDFPAYLCLDSVYVGCEGELLFLHPKNTGSCDAFYVAPEFQEHGIVTEKACVYGVAAILWATAKFHLCPNQKLAMPRKLKRLLLEMAKRTPLERPSIVMAKKSCRDYLSRQGTCAESVWTQLIRRIHKASNKVKEAESCPDLGSFRSSSPAGRTCAAFAGFVPLAADIRLAPVAGPVPRGSPTPQMNRLPKAFTSSATHFTPIVLAQERPRQEELPLADPTTSIPGVDILSNTDLVLKAAQHKEDWNQRERDMGKIDRVLHIEDFPPLSGSRAHLASPPYPKPQAASQEVSSNHTSSCSNFSCAAGVYNNFLLQQDPQTGCLTLFPVQIAISQPITGPDLSLSRSAGLEVDSANWNEECDESCVTQNGAYENHGTSSYHKKRKINMTIRAQQGAAEPARHTLDPRDTTGCRAAILEQVVMLVREEFAFDGYLENGVEELAMGEYILSLRSLHFETFSRAVVEKFSVLHWDSDLLGLLHCLINSLPPAFGEQPPSKPKERAWTSLTDARGHEGEGGQSDANVCHAPPSGPPVERVLTATPGLSQGETEGIRGHRVTEEGGGGETVVETSSTWEGTHQGSYGKCHHDSTDMSEARPKMKSGETPAGGAGEHACGAEAVCQSYDLEESRESQLTHDCSDAEMDDSCSLVSERPLSFFSGCLGALVSPAWALALYGHGCFTQDVVEYARKLGARSDSPSLEGKAQEAEQQLLIESRNLKKTRNFYHKLIHQEKKNKGSEAKAKLHKLKEQFEELRTKVAFLKSVRKYLQVLSVDQWGLALSLLPSLAASETSAVDLRPSEDPAILSLVCEQHRRTDCCPLVAGTAKGFMSYLYARNALLDGYIQQFLYTYRYFSSREEFLQFLMDKFKGSVGGSDDPSTDSAKVYHRTLDLLECWIGDCQLVDFPSKSRLHQSLNNFLTSEVAPVDSRGETLLSMLRNTSQKRWDSRVICLSGCPISSWEDDDVQSICSLCRKASVEEAARKSFPWRVGRVLEPQPGQPKEKVYSIAAALPRPCYSGLGVHTEERLAFSQTEHSPLNTTQQLTLLQQEIFQSCHPVHFLNSRAQGVREKAVNISKCSLSDSLPLEGSSLFVGVDSGQDGPLQYMIQYAESVTNWVSAEIVVADTVKAQASLLAKFLSIAKHCYETRNFATAMQILEGLENVIVRQLQAWKQLSTKTLEVLEELRAVQVFLKSDSLCLMEGERREQPTLPDAHTLAMHVQQLEIGAFTLASGAYKWTKLRSIARVVSQVHAFQEHVYMYPPDLELQAYLQARLVRLGTCDVTALAADNHANFLQPATERHARRIQDTLRRVKASFQ
ncbi:kinase non-catalytic C-lobe domain-containing protein 1 isoform X3 [Electrophorus electricus]|uniref:kinase non-catalytic C-lobe domain-containing protein 1 isoform X3 n=1 Tax=Electrophorus electricus TaxID=8005 RepID=UPI0015D04F99|nr:kinase non-catalytic C-lobe domain-containing protein 1 isoform X3 [Electrophorus electricus]